MSESALHFAVEIHGKVLLTDTKPWDRDWRNCQISKKLKKVSKEKEAIVTNSCSTIMKEQNIKVSETSCWHWPEADAKLPAVLLNHYSCVRLFATPWTVAHQAPLSVEFSRQEHWSALPCPPPGDLPDPGTEPSFHSLQEDSLPLSYQGSPNFQLYIV